MYALAVFRSTVCRHNVSSPLGNSQFLFLNSQNVLSNMLSGPATLLFWELFALCGKLGLWIAFICHDMLHMRHLVRHGSRCRGRAGGSNRVLPIPALWPRFFASLSDLCGSHARVRALSASDQTLQMLRMLLANPTQRITGLTLLTLDRLSIPGSGASRGMI